MRIIALALIDVGLVQAQDTESQEQAVMLDYYSKPVAYQWARVLNVFAFDEPVLVEKKQYSSRFRVARRLGDAMKVNDTDGLFVPHGVALPDLTETLRSWGVDTTISSLVSHILPHPLASLVARGEWKDVVFFDEWFKHEAVMKSWGNLRLGAPARPVPTLPVGAGDLDVFAGHLRRWAPLILQAHADNEEEPFFSAHVFVSIHIRREIFRCVYMYFICAFMFLCVVYMYIH